MEQHVQRPRRHSIFEATLIRQSDHVWQFRQEMVDDDGETRLRQIQADQTV